MSFWMKFKVMNNSFNNKIECLQCQYLMFSDCYGECSKGNIHGIVQPHFSCGKGVIRNVDKSKD
jgi:hypothetical protein